MTEEASPDPVAGAELDPDLVSALEQARYLEVVTTGRRSGRAHQVVVWFGFRDGAVYVLAHARDHGRGTDWYRNLVAAGGATVRAGRRRARVVPVPFPPGADPHRFTVALLESKYGAGAVDTWYDPALRIPVRALITR